MKNLHIYSLVILLSFFSMRCSTSKTTTQATDTKKEQSMEQGIMGKIIWKQGNMMPQFGDSKKSGVVEGTIRDIFIYEVVNKKALKQAGPFYKDIPTKMVAKGKSAEDGSFKIQLEPGTYSMFTKEPNGLYGNLTDGQGNLSVVKVEKGKYTEIKFEVSYEAAY